jgi:hypothetical protein
LPFSLFSWFAQKIGLLNLRAHIMYYRNAFIRLYS